MRWHANMFDVLYTQEEAPECAHATPWAWPSRPGPRGIAASWCRASPTCPDTIGSTKGTEQASPVPAASADSPAPTLPARPKLTCNGNAVGFHPGHLCLLRLRRLHRLLLLLGCLLQNLPGERNTLPHPPRQGSRLHDSARGGLHCVLGGDRAMALRRVQISPNRARPTLPVRVHLWRRWQFPRRSKGRRPHRHQGRRHQRQRQPTRQHRAGRLEVGGPNRSCAQSGGARRGQRSGPRSRRWAPRLWKRAQPPQCLLRAASAPPNRPLRREHGCRVMVRQRGIMVSLEAHPMGHRL